MTVVDIRAREAEVIAYARTQVAPCRRAVGYEHRYCCDAHATILNGQAHGDYAETAGWCSLYGSLLAAEIARAWRLGLPGGEKRLGYGDR